MHQRNWSYSALNHPRGKQAWGWHHYLFEPLPVPVPSAEPSDDASLGSSLLVPCDANDLPHSDHNSNWTPTRSAVKCIHNRTHLPFHEVRTFRALRTAHPHPSGSEHLSIPRAHEPLVVRVPTAQQEVSPTYCWAASASDFGVDSHRRHRSIRH